jgi:RHS repeat-associated protein
MDNLDYQYYPDGNRLQRVDDSVTAATGADDIKDQAGNNYNYNSIGQLVSNVQDDIAYSYTTSGLVSEINMLSTSAPLLKFAYGDKGKRVKKQAYVNGSLAYTDYYVRDASGNVMAIYRNGNLTEQPIYGNSRLGVHYRNSGSDVYELTDHLGNVRAVVSQQAGTPIAVMAKTDYYPFGMAMPGRHVDGDYRYAYQGQEKDDETGMEAFELRLWDARIGRWLTVDPYNEFFSPYLGMANNPISTIDPDGGCTDCDPPVIDLAPVYITTTVSRPDTSNFDFSGMPDFMKFPEPGRTWTSSFDRSLAEYNATFNTGFSYDKPGDPASQYQYQFYYKPQYDAMRAAMHEGWKVIAVTLAAPIVIIGAAETLPALALATQTGSVSSLTQGIMIRHGIRRVVFRNSVGQFARGTGMRETSRMYFQRMGLNGLGQATRTTSTIPPNWGAITRWTVGAGLSGATGYYSYKKLFGD